MQKASDKYKESMKQPFRNRAYVKGSIGVINSEAQNAAAPYTTSNKIAYFSNGVETFQGKEVTNVYATCEQNFSKLDGSMFFLPKKDSGMTYYFNGIVSENPMGAITINFGDLTALTIKGLTVDFGENYPIEFTVQGGTSTYTKTNDSQKFVMEDVFEGVDALTITPTKMLLGDNTRLRINSISFGFANTFDSTKVIECSSKEYVSSISDSLPSRDVEITLDNQNGYYDPENDESAMAFLSAEQEVKLSFGYDIDGNGTIEWTPEILSYLKSWSATDTEAKFTATDIFDDMDDNYYKGTYSILGTTLYDLATDVLNDAGISEENYYVDPYLKKVKIHNPMPVVKHSEALQIIANAGRCSLSEDRTGKISIVSSFVPEKTVTTNGNTEYSNLEAVLNDSNKNGYANASTDFSAVDGSLLFLPKNSDYKQPLGYVSKQVSDENGLFSTNPKITIKADNAFDYYKFFIRFKNVIPLQFILTAYSGTDVVVNKTVDLVEEVQNGYYSWTHNMYQALDTKTGEVKSSYGVGSYVSYTSSFIEISEDAKKIIVKRDSGNNVASFSYCLYDKDKKYIQGGTATSLTLKDFDGSEKYLRLSYSTKSGTKPIAYPMVEKPIETDNYTVEDSFESVDRFVVEFTKTQPNSRVFVDYIGTGDYTNYHLTRFNLTESPEAVRQDRIKAISVVRTTYSAYNREVQDLVTETFDLSKDDTERTVYFNEASFDLEASVKDNSAITVKIKEKSSYYAVLEFSGVTGDVTVEVTVSGSEYQQTERPYTVEHESTGETIQWSNPLISEKSHAADVEEWLASYYLGKIDYNLKWRGDPVIDANDVMYLELKNLPEQTIRAYENTLTFNGAFDGEIKARTVVL